MPWIRIATDDSSAPTNPPSLVAPGRSSDNPEERDVILVEIAKYANAIGLLRLFIRSLRATGSTADVFVIGHSMNRADNFQHVRDGAKAECGVRFFSYSVDAVTDSFEGMGLNNPLPGMITMAVMASVLRHHPARNVLIAPLDTLFQREPFANVYQRDGSGITMFISSPIRFQEQQPGCLAGVFRGHEKSTDVIPNLVLGSHKDVSKYEAAVCTARIDRCQIHRFDPALTEQRCVPSPSPPHPISVERLRLTPPCGLTADAVFSACR